MTNNTDKLLEKLSRFRPRKSETFAYQADGYAAGWNAAIAGFHEHIRTLIAQGEGE